VTLRNAPPKERDGGDKKVICGRGQEQFLENRIFLQKGLDGGSAGDPTGNRLGPGEVERYRSRALSIRARASANPESRAIHLWIPGLRQEAHPGMTREYGARPARLLVPIMRDH
jgi:hypothetical protein